jgi:hypothetical protein
MVKAPASGIILPGARSTFRMITSPADRLVDEIRPIVTVAGEVEVADVYFPSMEAVAALPVAVMTPAISLPVASARTDAPVGRVIVAWIALTVAAVLPCREIVSFLDAEPIVCSVLPAIVVTDVRLLVLVSIKVVAAIINVVPTQ